MKNAGKYADELKNLLKRLLKDGKPQPLAKVDPVRAMVRATMSFDAPDARADEAVKVVEREFVDLNELRVATELELQAMIGFKYPLVEKRASIIVQLLNGIFEKEGTLSLDRLGTLKKADARQIVRDLPGMTPFLEGSILMFCFEQAVMPLDDAMLAYLKAQGAVDETFTVPDAQKFIENHLKLEELHDLYVCLRRVVYGPSTVAADSAKKAKTKA
jgi:endonuclease III